MESKRFVVAFCLLVLLTGSGFAVAQEQGRIEGRVTREDGSGITGVSVRLDQLDQVVLSDAMGNFAFADVPPGSYTLTYSLLDYTDTQEAVEVASGQTASVDRVLDWDVSFAESITVTSVSRRQERITQAPAAVTVIPEREIEQEASTGQVPKLLEFTPGVDFAQSGLYDINFNTRGFNSSLNRRILTLIDGRDPAVPFLGSQEWAAVSFPMDELASVELVRGPGSALYGANAFNGVLNMTTKSPRGSEGGQIRLTAGEPNSRRADLRWAGGFGNDYYVKVVGGYQQSDDFTRSRNQTVEYSRFCTATGQTNCLRQEARALALDEAKIGFGGLRLDKYFGSSVLTVEGGTAQLEGPTFLTGIGRVQVTDVSRPWTRVNFNTDHFNVLAYYDTRKAEKQVALASAGFLYEDSSNLHGEVQGNAGFGNGKGFLVGGLSYHEQEVDTANPAGIQTLIKTEARSEDQQAAFAQVDYSFTDKLKAVLAGRVDESTLHDTQFSPKASLVYSFTPTNTLRLTYNQAFQVPNYSEFFLRVAAGRPIEAFAPLENALAPLLGGRTLGLKSIPILALGNDNLDVEEITSYELGYSSIIASKLFLTVDYYQSEVENFVTDLLPGINPQYTGYAPPAFLPAPVRTQILNTLRGGLGAANFSGLVDLNGQPTLVLSYANAGLVDTQGVDVAFNYYITNGWVADFNYSWFDFEVKSSQLGDQLLPNAPENKASAGLSYNGDRFGASVKYRWVEEFPWAAGVFVGFVPSYDVVDLGMSYRFTDSLEVGVDVSNLFDEEQFQTFGGDLVTRRALGHVAFSW
ncbi:MAG: iron complex outerrane recepter protein [Acidobacteriota bacterium]|jgi:iron complex outermembrane receptor protein|nr:iron complex outerrane recepter protein [Acidobacteriota bacterium]